MMGGATLSFLSLAKGIKEKGNDIDVIIPSKGELLQNELSKIGINPFVHDLPPKVYPSLYNWKQYIRWPYTLFDTLIRNRKARKFIVRLINENHYDIVHTNVGPLHMGYEACRITDTPHVWHIREYGDLDFKLYEFPSKYHFRKKLNRSNVITITRALLEYNELESYPKAQVIYNGVRSVNDVAYINNKKKYFLSASRISAEKGFDQMIRVFSEFCKTDSSYLLVILGGGNISYINKLKKQCLQCGIEKNVIFKGYSNDVSSFMREAKALLVCSDSEGFGRMTAEAAFDGCMVIGKNQAGTKEVMDITGGLRFITDDEMLQQMVKVVKMSEEEYQSNVMYAQQCAKKLFSKEQYVDEVYKMYQTIIMR